MKLFLIIVYNVIAYPFIFLFVFFFSLFNTKLKKNINGRFKSISKINRYFNNNNIYNTYWFHVSSLGEFYQVKPILEYLKKYKKKSTIILSFSSSSGYENSYCQSVDLKIYIPFDFPWIINNMLNLINPKKIIICSYDIWPNLLWIANKKNIHVNIFSLYIKKRPFFYNIIWNLFHKVIYSDFSSIYTITKTDKIKLLDLLGIEKNIKIRVCGNPRYDTVQQMALINIQYYGVPITNREKIIIIASSHKEDDFIIPILIEVLNKYPKYKILYAPHEPTKKEIKRLKNKFISFNRNPLIMTNKDSEEIPNKQLVILGVVGILYKLYWQSQIVYMGGGFSKGIHNIMEPAIAGVPIIFGPKYNHANEATILLNNGGGFDLQNKNQFKQIILKLINDPITRKKSGKLSGDLFKNNIGASSKIAQYILND